jgi:transcriptional regulator with XRE-family HTH domain
MNRIAGFQITAGRALLGWSIADLAKRSGVSVRMVKRAEANPEAISPSKLAAICAAFIGAGVVFIRDMSRMGVALDLRGR